jgi:SpoVK/Ycf46/Vps4 family AAA+-type ATPase
MITKFMGETAAKLKLVFDAMQTAKGVLLFDEFDAIGAQRALPNDTGEIRRILNSFLQFIEADDSESVIVAATNHAEILDRALVRRFDDVVVYELPDRQARLATLKHALAAFPVEHGWDRIVRETAGLSFAEIVGACEDAAKEMVLEKRAAISGVTLAAALRARKKAHVAVSSVDRN